MIYEVVEIDTCEVVYTTESLVEALHCAEVMNLHSYGFGFCVCREGGLPV